MLQKSRKLGFSEQLFYYFNQSSSANLVIELTLSEKINKESLENAINQLSNHNQFLKVNLQHKEGLIFFTAVDKQKTVSELTVERYQEHKQNRLNYVFKENEFLYKIDLLQTETNSTILATFSHIISDFTSVNFFLDDLLGLLFSNSSIEHSTTEIPLNMEQITNSKQKNVDLALAKKIAQADVIDHWKYKNNVSRKFNIKKSDNNLTGSFLYSAYISAYNNCFKKNDIKLYVTCDLRTIIDGLKNHLSFYSVGIPIKIPYMDRQQDIQQYVREQVKLSLSSQYFLKKSLEHDTYHPTIISVANIGQVSFKNFPEKVCDIQLLANSMYFPSDTFRVYISSIIFNDTLTITLNYDQRTLTTDAVSLYFDAIAERVFDAANPDEKKNE